MQTLHARSYTICFLVLILSLAVGCAWYPWNIFSRQDIGVHFANGRRAVGHIAHRPATDTLQDDLRPDGAWYNGDVNPLFYSAWRGRPGPITAELSMRSSVVRYGARVACWSSSGGVWIKHANLVDMDFLGLDHWKDTPRNTNQTEEDQFCTLLKMIGAEWWELPPLVEQLKGLQNDQSACDTLEMCFEPSSKFNFLIAWPESEKAACVIPIERALAKGEQALLKYHNSMSMDERCGAIMSLGGRWCKCQDSCLEMKGLDWGPRDPGPDACDDPPLVMFDVNDPNKPSDWPD